MDLFLGRFDDMIRALSAVMARELRKTIRQKSRLLASTVRPLIWLFIIGGGIGSITENQQPGSYQEFIIPGILGMTLLFGAMLSALTTVYDKESGVMRMMVIAPLPSYWISLSKMLSATIAGLIQGFILCIILVISGLTGLSQLASVEFVAAVTLTALACSGLGMLTAAISKSLDNFAAIMNFVIFPVFFLSGALYPVSTLPAEIQWITIINPFTYGVDLLKHAVHTEGGHSVDFSMMLDCIILALFTIFALAISSWQFGRESTRSTLIGTLTRAKN